MIETSPSIFHHWAYIWPHLAVPEEKNLTSWFVKIILYIPFEKIPTRNTMHFLQFWRGKISARKI